MVSCSICINYKKQTIKCNICLNWCCQTCFVTNFLTNDKLTCLFCNEHFFFVDVYSQLSKSNMKIIKGHIIKILSNIYFTEQICEIHKQYGEILCSNIICDGKINSITRICNKCNLHLCIKCNEMKEKHHVCIQNDVLSINFINTYTKKCPSCCTKIEKIDGCNQMWCIFCHTTFDWNTGKLDSSKIHNPHYFKYVKSNKDVYNISKLPNLPSFIDNIKLIFRDEYKPYIIVYRLLIQIHNEYIFISHENIYHELTCSYKNNEISKYSFEKKIFSVYKYRNIFLTIKNIFTFTYYNCVNIINIVNKILFPSDSNIYINILHNYISNANKEFNNLYKKVKMLTPFIKIEDNSFKIYPKFKFK
jgi:hypothetical protein